MRITVTESFRRSMHRLHTWFGVAVASVLFAIFWMGTLTVFDAEIDQWMKPELRFDRSGEALSLDDLVRPHLSKIEEAQSVNISPANWRKPTLDIGYSENGAYQQIHINPADGSIIQPTDTQGATGFFFGFHFYLHLGWKNIGYYIVGIASMAMLGLTVSGIFIHRKIIADFFTFRPRKALRRSTLDLHNLTGVVALPFYIIMPMSGLLIIASIYLPWSLDLPHAASDSAEASGHVSIERTGEPTPELVSLDTLVQQAEAEWSARTGQVENADFIRIKNFQDKTAYLEVRQVFPSRRIEMDRFISTFRLSDGARLKSFESPPAQSTVNWLSGFHFVQFEHWPLRWLYFLGGLCGCTMIGSGLLFWIRARVRKDEEATGPVAFVRVLTIGSTTGLIAATTAFMLTNRLIPAAWSSPALSRSDAEVVAFLAVWALAFVHSATRGGRAWSEQSLFIGLTGLTCVLANWLTTGDHIVKASLNSLWSLAGTDAVLIAGAVVGFACFRELRPTVYTEAASGEKLSSERFTLRTQTKAER
ncbi:MAG: PepSY-associated TM helix domain-containing protein [Pseudomonadota bacterium]